MKRKHNVVDKLPLHSCCQWDKCKHYLDLQAEYQVVWILGGVRLFVFEIVKQEDQRHKSVVRSIQTLTYCPRKKR